MGFWVGFGGVGMVGGRDGPSMRVFHGRKTIVGGVMGVLVGDGLVGLVCGFSRAEYFLRSCVVVDRPSNTRIWGSYGPRGTGWRHTTRREAGCSEDGRGVQWSISANIAAGVWPLKYIERLCPT